MLAISGYSQVSVNTHLGVSNDIVEPRTQSPLSLFGQFNEQRQDLAACSLIKYAIVVSLAIIVMGPARTDCQPATISSKASSVMA